MPKRLLVEWRRVTGLLLCAVWLLVLIGCAAQEESEMAVSESTDRAAAGAAAEQAPAPASPGDAPAQNGATGADEMASLVKPVSAIPRKIIYTADVSLVADNLSQAQQKLMALVQKYKGYVAESNVGGAAGTQRQGSWKVRLPVENYDIFMAEVARLAEVQTIHSDSQDVSEEYYDLQARISNKQVEEKRLIQHLQDTTAKLEDILTVEKEISRVRGEIEQMQGRLRVLANLTALATVTVSITEIENYVPPAPPTFGAQISRTFGQSWGALVDVGKGLVLLAVALLPWFVVLLVLLIPILLLARRYARLQPKTTNPLNPNPEPRT